MHYDIRPLSFAEILDRAFRILLDNFALLVGLTAIVWIPYGVLQGLARTRPEQTVLALVFTYLASPVVLMAQSIAVASVYLGQPTTIGEAYRTVSGNAFKYIGTFLLMSLLVALGFVLIVLPGVYLVVAWLVVFPVMAVEHRFGGAALRRSRELVKGVWWQTFGVMLAVAAIAIFPSIGPRLLWGSIPYLGPILTAALSSVTGSYSSTALVVYYIDRRCRTEEFDLRLLAEQVRAEGGATVRAAAGANPVA